jgi:hypothetical protein
VSSFQALRAMGALHVFAKPFVVVDSVEILRALLRREI